MKKILLSIILLLLITSVSYCKDQPLQLTIKFDKEVYVVGEEIKINLTLKNISKENVTIIKRTGYQHTDLIIDGLDRDGRLVKEYGENYPRTAYFYIYPSKNDFLILKPNEHWNTTIYVFESIEAEIIKELLKETGRHTISVLYYIDDAQVKNASELGFQLSTLKLVSNTITIKVVGKKVISKEEALKIAEKVCKEQGWQWKDVNVIDGEDRWQIFTNSGQHGGNAVIEVDKDTGEVLNKIYYPY